MTDLPWRSTRSLFAALVLLAGSAAVCPPATAAPHPLPALLPGLLSAGLVDERPQPITAALARVYLRKLPVGRQSSLDGYDHAKFLPEWAPQRGTCDTREIVLHRDGHFVQRDEACRAVGGTWYSRYDGRTLVSTDQIDVDHLVSLANAWVSGADEWHASRRREFANDLVRPELVAVSESANMDKSGSSPATWRPPVTGYWCTYARSWVTVKYHYDLRVTEREKDALADMLESCPTNP